MVILYNLSVTHTVMYMNKCVRCKKEFTDIDNTDLSSGVSIHNKCVDCTVRAKQPFLERFKTICKPERPVTRKEYRTIFTITLSLTLLFLVGSLVSFAVISLLFSGLSGQDPIAIMVENLSGILLTAALPAMLMFIAFGVATSLGIFKRSLLEFTPLNQNQSNIIAVASVALLTITGIIFIFAIFLGIVVSIRAIRRFSAKPAE